MPFKLQRKISDKLSYNVTPNSNRALIWPVQTGLFNVLCPLGWILSYLTHFTNASLCRHQSEDGAVIRNIDACRTIAQTVQTSLGPYGRNKIVINHLQKMILTNDAATILRELEVVHPAAKLVVMASQQQEAEVRMLRHPISE